ncbi:MAG: hypothetical protein ACRDQH_05050 [Pseudonocardiaceae bacterium]
MGVPRGLRFGPGDLITTYLTQEQPVGSIPRIPAPRAGSHPTWCAEQYGDTRIYWSNCYRSNGTNETSGSYRADIDRYSAILNRAVAVLVWVIVGAFALSLVFVY